MRFFPNSGPEPPSKTPSSPCATGIPFHTGPAAENLKRYTQNIGLLIPCLVLVRLPKRGKAFTIVKFPAIGDATNAESRGQRGQA